MTGLNVTQIASGSRWRLSRVRVTRTRALGATLVTGQAHQRCMVGGGGLLVGRPGTMTLLGAGHSVKVLPGTRLLVVPFNLDLWLLSTDSEEEEDAPSVEHNPPVAKPIDIPLDPPGTRLDENLCNDWLGLPFDVATWASALDVRATSLAQRTRRLCGVTPKQVLGGVRATLTLALAESFEGRGAALALDTGYASQAHMSSDLKRRLGLSLSELSRIEDGEGLEWFRLLRSALR